jgi:hypothetical protein
MMATTGKPEAATTKDPDTPDPKLVEIAKTLALAYRGDEYVGPIRTTPDAAPEEAAEEPPLLTKSQILAEMPKGLIKRDLAKLPTILDKINQACSDILAEAPQTLIIKMRDQANQGAIKTIAENIETIKEHIVMISDCLEEAFGEYMGPKEEALKAKKNAEALTKVTALSRQARNAKEYAKFIELVEPNEEMETVFNHSQALIKAVRAKIAKAIANIEIVQEQIEDCIIGPKERIVTAHEAAIKASHAKSGPTRYCIALIVARSRQGLTKEAIFEAAQQAGFDFNLGGIGHHISGINAALNGRIEIENMKPGYIARLPKGYYEQVAEED